MLFRLLSQKRSFWLKCLKIRKIRQKIGGNSELSLHCLIPSQAIHLSNSLVMSF